jgi:Tfp pilus assembly protein PilN
MLRIDLQVDAGIGARGGRLQRVLNSRLVETLQDPAIAGSLLLGVVVLVLAIWVDHRSSTRYEAITAEVEQEQQEQSRLRDDLKRTQDLADRRETLQKLIGRVSAVDRNRFGFVHLMDQVAAAIPNNVWIEALLTNAMEEESRRIDFRIHGYTPSMDVLGVFMQQLESSPFLTGITYVSSSSEKLSGNDVLRFELSGFTQNPDEAFLESVTIRGQSVTTAAPTRGSPSEVAEEEAGIGQAPPANAPPLPGGAEPGAPPSPPTSPQR